MDQNRILQQFEEIEQKVETLINRCKSLESDNEQLINEIERLERELQGKTEAEDRFKEERSQIRSAMDSLMARLGSAIQIG